ncbi:MAG: HAMP domain-containing sensor histidine kinase [Clostridium sp.]|uniref:sensor histidine kinase n=1 Tax=Clostridium sp. TaxID=1506 RepID=UPI00306C50CC
MTILLDKDERVKIGIFILIIFIIQGFIFYRVNSKMLLEVNDRYVKQNISIVGSIYDSNKELGEKIIPIITGKTTGNYDLGKEVMNKYSYEDSLKLNFNPLFEDLVGSFNVSVVVIVLGGLVITLVGILYLINPVYKEIVLLTKRAENIVDNKFTLDKSYRYKGSLDKFIDKFNGMEDRIQNSIQLLKEEKVNLKNIINDISHQLKTPLMALSMYNEILNDHREMDSEDIDNFINLSKEQLERMDWLVKTLLKYARLESNVVEYHKEYFSLTNTIEESINPLKIKAEEKNQRLILMSTKEVLYYHDRKWISEALSNIIKNAIEHTGDNGKIEISLEETPISITIGVKDNGEGIEKSELKKIFNRFHKGENSINPSSIGIGLCLSKSIIKAHNGDIRVDSQVGVGSTFYITFLKTVV